MSMRPWLGLFALACIGVACAHDPPPVAPRPSPAKPVVAASAQPVAPSDAGAPTRTLEEAWALDYPTSWTDPRVIELLAADCDVVIPERPRDPEWNSGFEPSDLFHCKPAWSQSCVQNDMCWGEQQACNDSCGATCGGCSTTCAASCKSCKETCTDAACKTACATKCADCKQTCNRTMDRCASGTCKNESDVCYKRYDRIFDACKGSCAPYSKCVGGCQKHSERGDYEKFGHCVDACRSKKDARYDACSKKCPENEASCEKKCVESTCPTIICNYRD